MSRLSGGACEEIRTDDAPQCPWCETIDFDWWDGRSQKSLVQGTEMQCGACEKTYVVTADFRVSFTTKKQLAGAGNQGM
jgi:hypothetical protein